ncbi:FlgB family protein [Halodurantibacterium flavum]|uniref:FlgB family protein n=1 Tax=Halodurantibacterium flavum TaxID=1382802 RepID=A0ABW4S8C6_9RHOB
MFRQLELFKMAHGLAAHAASRQGVIAQNVAHADTPGYRARDIASFSDVWRQQGGGGLRQTRMSHDFGPASGARLQEVRAGSSEPNGNSVSLEQQMIHAAEVRHQHDLALSVYRTASTVLRKSLGR